MSQLNIVRVPAGTLVFFDDVGIAVSADRAEPEYGAQPRVTINTEEAPARDVAPDGAPILWIGLNDADLYDREALPLSDGHARRIASEWHDGQASELYRLASTGAISDDTLDEVRRTAAQPGNDTAHQELQLLLTYVARIGPRGPVAGWHHFWDATCCFDVARPVEVAALLFHPAQHGVVIAAGRFDSRPQQRHLAWLGGHQGTWLDRGEQRTN